MPVALALIVGLTAVVMATQLQVVTELKASRAERNYDHALQMAEAGLNAYINLLANGTATGANSGYVPPLTPANAPNSVITLAAFRTGVLNGTYALTRYPANSQTGYYVYKIATGNAAFVRILSYGWSNGIARRVQATAQSFSIFDWAAIYGLDPLVSNQDYAWKFTGSANLVGASGGEGLFIGGNNVTFYDGPVIWARGAYAAPFNNADPSVLVSSSNVPQGHSGAGGLASPLYRHYLRSLDVPTADEAANDASGSTTGVAWFKTHNDNATGLRYLVKNATTGVIRELNDPTKPYTVMASNDYQLNNEFSGPNSATLTNLGMQAGEAFYGLRAYPGNYYFEQVNMQNSDRLSIRSFTDAERGTLAGRSYVVSGDPANPNSGQASNANVRFWIGQTSGNDPATTFDVNTTMEYPGYASRFRVYIASRGGVNVRGRNQNPPPPFRVNLLSYNKDSSGNGYGNVAFSSSTYLYGSLLGWKIDVSGGCTIQKEATEIGPGDKLTYVVTDWRELP